MIDIEDPIKILVDMAEQGDLDPWNIDLVEVTDNFLARIDEMERLDIRIPARTLLYASILLRMKSEELVDNQFVDDGPLDDEEVEPLEMYFDVEDYPIPKPPVRRRARRPVTLDELIEELRAAEKVERRKITRKQERRRRESERVTIEEVLEIAHEEDLEQRIENLWVQLQGMFNGGNGVRFSDLVKEPTKQHIIDTYIPLLYLATRKMIRIEQPRIFEEIFIKRIGGAPVEPEGGS